MLRFLGMLTIIGLAFIWGVYIGLEGTDAVLHKAKQLSAQVLASTSALERNLSLRSSLVNAKERLVQVKVELLDKNYGKQALKKAMEAADEENKQKLKEEMEKVEAVKRDVQALKTGVQARVDEIVNELDGLLTR